MGAPKKYERDLVERAVRMYRDQLAGGGDFHGQRPPACRVLSGPNPRTLRICEDEERRINVRPPIKNIVGGQLQS